MCKHHCHKKRRHHCHQKRKKVIKGDIKVCQNAEIKGDLKVCENLKYKKLERISKYEFNIGFGEFFQPWLRNSFPNDVPVGLDPTMVREIAKAAGIKVNLVKAPFGDAIQSGPKPGPGLVLDFETPDQRPGPLDGYMTWFSTQERKDVGFAFSDNYSIGPPQVFIALESTVINDAFWAGNVKIGYYGGLVASPNCIGLTPEMEPSANREWIEYDIDNPQPAYDALDNGDIDLFFKDLGEPFLNALATKNIVQDGSDNVLINCAEAGLSLLTYPVSQNQDRIAKLIQLFNCGLDKIRLDGTFVNISDQAGVIYNNDINAPGSIFERANPSPTNCDSGNPCDC